MRTLAAAALLLAGCASVDPYARPPIAEHLLRTDAVGECARLFARIDAAVDAAGRRDALAPRVAGFPYLRVDRLSALLRPAPTDDAAWAAWRDRLGALDRAARTYELADPALAEADAEALAACRVQLAAEDAARRHELAAAARVPDDYSTVQRALGLYPLTKLAFAAGVRRWQRQVRADFATSLAQLPVAGTLTRYAPRAPLLLSHGQARAEEIDALGLPRLEAATVEALFARHAPLLEVDTVDGHDRIGRLRWSDGGRRVAVDTAQPVAYARLTFARFAGRMVPQLVYTFWFPGRPPKWRLDPLAGHLDGLIWRVTLEAGSLEPLVYDSIHPCGCYHLFFPTARVRARPQPIAGEGRWDETLFAPQTAPTLRDGERIALRIAAGSHDLQRVFVVPEPLSADHPYTLRDEDMLRALPWPDERNPRGLRSAFGPDGLIAGSQRLERFFFWPMGIASAGAMRQWGRHATAF
ncbi:MAG: hypothetical protein NZL99_04690, partial [Burkholderiaceae bacterium]|nr:hypothetical protein [Burkholderiaceae bacterium]